MRERERGGVEWVYHPGKCEREGEGGGWSGYITQVSVRERERGGVEWVYHPGKCEREGEGRGGVGISPRSV